MKSTTSACETRAGAAAGTRAERRAGRAGRPAAAAPVPATALVWIAVLGSIAALPGCAVVSVAGAAAGAAIAVTGAVVSTGIKVTGKVVEKTIDAVTPSGDK